MNIFSIAVMPFLLSLGISILLVPLTVIIFRALGWVIDPAKSPHPAHIHTEPVPKGGGLPVFIAILVSALVLLPLDKHLIAILVACLISVVVGVVDDVRGVSPYVRLGVNILVALIVVGSGIGIAFVSNPLGGMIDLSVWKFGFTLWGYHEIWILPDLFALLWIPALMNAINWSSGVDGQISGVVSIAGIVMGLISLTYSADISQWPVSVLAWALAGAFLGLTIYHAYPQKIMPGYSATSLAGLLLAVLSIMATAKIGTAMVVLGVPLMDFGYIFVRRIMSGKSPVWGDKSHLHHQLLKMGWSKARVAMFYWGVTAVLGIMAVTLGAGIKMVIMGCLGILLLLFYLWRRSINS